MVSSVDGWWSGAGSPASMDPHASRAKIMGSSVDGKCAGAVGLASMDEPFGAKPCTVLDFFDDHWFCWNLNRNQWGQ